jgi:hypothetical protein
MQAQDTRGGKGTKQANVNGLSSSIIWFISSPTPLKTPIAVAAVIEVFAEETHLYNA